MPDNDWVDDDGWEDDDEEQPGLLDKIGKFVGDHPRIKEMGTRFLTGTSPEFEASLKARGINKVLGTPESENSLLPEWKSQPETYWGGFSKSIYNDFVRPQFTPSGALGNASPGLGGKGRFGRVEVEDLGNVPPSAPQRKLLSPGKTYVSPKGTAYQGGLPIRKSKEIPYKLTDPPTVKDAGPSPIDAIAIEGEVLPAQDLRIPPVSDDLVRKLKSDNPPIIDDAGGTDWIDITDSGVPETPINPTQLQQFLTSLQGEVNSSLPSTQPPIRPNFANPFEEPERSVTAVVQQELADYKAKFLERQRNQPDPDTDYFREIDAERKSFEQAHREANPPLDVPLPAKTTSGKLAIGADIKSLSKVLGTSLYKGDIAPIVAKELLQNSVDSVRHLGDAGQVDVTIHQGDRYIQVADNGKGMTKEELETVFTDLGASGKRNDESAVGGFGLAKAAPLLGGERVEVTSIAIDPKTGHRMESSFSGTPEELVSGVDIKYKVVSNETPLGTKVKVFVPQGSSFYEAGKYVREMASNSHGATGSIRLAESMTPGRQFTKGDYRTMERAQGKELTKLNNPSAETSLIVPTNAKLGNRSYITLKLSNNGMYQGEKVMYLDNPVPNIPESVIVNVRSKVPEGHADYPFTANREELRGTVEAQVKQYINDNLVNPSLIHRAKELQKLYDEMPEVNVGKGDFPNTFGRTISIYDPKGQITPDEMQEIVANPAFQSLAGDISTIIDKVMQSVDNAVWNERLEKVGIIFNEEVHGIHIPNPKTGKSAILINPFPSMANSTPDQATANILHTILHEVAHVEPMSPGHNESFTVRLGDIYSRFGARRTVDAQDRILKSITDDTGTYSPEVRELLQRYSESRGRAATTEDLLSGTGIKSESTGRGKGRVSKPSGQAGTGTSPTSSAVNKLFEAIRESKPLREEQEAINRATRAARFAESAGVKATGMKGAAQSLGKMKGEYEKVEGPTIKLGIKETNELFTAIKKANVTEAEKIKAYATMFKLINGGNVPSRSELKVLDDIFGGGFSSNIVELHGGLGAVGIKIGKTANTMKALMSSVDLSGPMKQGAGLIHRKEWREAARDMLKFFASQEAFDASTEAIERHPKYLVSRQAGLFLAKPDDMLQGEEAFMNNYVADMPFGPKSLGVRNIVAASERAYVGFLNKVRFDTFNTLTELARRAGHQIYTVAEAVGEDGVTTRSIVPTKITENIAKYINVSTGRGGLGRFEKIAPELNMAFWSPRLMTSRLTALNPKYYMDLDPFTRKEAIKSLFAIAGTSTVLNTLGALAGATVGYNILSSDFMKSRFGRNVVDPNAGFQQLIVAAARMIEEAKRLSEGRKPEFGKPGILEIGTNYLRNKESPMASLADSILTARQFTGGGNYNDRYGNKTSIPIEVRNRFIPIFLQDVRDVFNSDTELAKALGLNAAALVGIGVQDYPERKTERETPMKMRKMRMAP